MSVWCSFLVEVEVLYAHYLKRAIIPWHRAHTLSNADTLLPPILLPENQSKIQLLTFILVRGKKKKKELKQLGLIEALFFRIADLQIQHKLGTNKKKNPST